MSEHNRENKEDRVRFKRLNQVCHKALDESMKVITDENLKMCYPSLYNTKEGKHAISTAKGTFKETWPELAGKNFQDIFKERDIESKLDELDDLITQAEQRKKSGDDRELPNDQLTPVNVVSSHLVPVKEANLKNLEKQLQDLRNGNQRLLNELNAISKEATNIKTDVSRTFETLEGFESLAKDSNLNEKLQHLMILVSTEEKGQII